MSDKEQFLASGEKAGVLKLAAFNRAMAEAMEYLSIQDALDHNVHKEYGLTAKNFCKRFNVSYVTYKRRKEELSLMGQDLWALTKALGFGLSNLRDIAALPENALSKVKMTDTHLSIDGKDIPLENREELVEAISAIVNTAEELKAQQKAQARVSTQNHKTIDNLHKSIESLEKKIGASELPGDEIEEDFVLHMQTLSAGFETYISKVHPDYLLQNEMGDKRKPTPMMRAAISLTLET